MCLKRITKKLKFIATVESPSIELTYSFLIFAVLYTYFFALLSLLLTIIESKLLILKSLISLQPDESNPQSLKYLWFPPLGSKDIQ